MGKYIVGLSDLKKSHTVQLHDRNITVSYDLRISPLVHRFGQIYRLTLNDDRQTSFNLPWITELLVNFGPIGVIAGMAVFGLFLAGLDRLFNELWSILVFGIWIKRRPDQPLLLQHRL